jgi:hypothetical protein
MPLTVVGCSGSIPSRHSPASCYLLEADGFRLVVDMGSGALGDAFGGPVWMAAPGQVLDLSQPGVSWPLAATSA